MIPKDYLAIEDKKEDAAIAKPPLVEESKMGEQTSSQKEEKCGLGPNSLFCKAQKKEADLPHQQEHQQQKPLPKPPSQKVQYTKHNQDETTVGARDGKVEYKI